MSWELDRLTVSGWLAAAENSGAKDPDGFIALIRKTYNTAVSAYGNQAKQPAAIAIMASMASKLAGSWSRTSPADAVDAARDAAQDAKKALAELDPFAWLKTVAIVGLLAGGAYVGYRWWKSSQKKGKKA